MPAWSFKVGLLQLSFVANIVLVPKIIGSLTDPSMVEAANAQGWPGYGGFVLGGMIAVACLLGFMVFMACKLMEGEP